MGFKKKHIHSAWEAEGDKNAGQYLIGGVKFKRIEIKNLLFSASKEAGLTQEIRETFFKHPFLYTISVTYGHLASTTSAAALGVRSPVSLLSSPSSRFWVVPS